MVERSTTQAHRTECDIIKIRYNKQRLTHPTVTNIVTTAHKVAAT